MNKAIKQANIAERLGEVPVGAVLVIENSLIFESHNQSIILNDPSAHAEIIVIREACKKIQNYRLSNATLYTTLEPCVMCFGAIVHSRISKVVFGAYDPKTGSCGSCINLNENSCLNHKPEIIGGVLEDECSDLLKMFFKKKEFKLYTSRH